MTQPMIIAVFVGIPLTLAALDLVDRFATRQRGDGLRLQTTAFLLGVLLVYWAVQFGGFALISGLTDADSLARRASEGQSTFDDSPALARVAKVLLFVAVLFYVGGLWDYLLHRFVSHSRWLWFTHEYHHLPSQVFVLMPGMAARPFAVVSTAPVAAATVLSAYGLAAFLGMTLDLLVLQVLLLLQTTVLTASHSCCLRRWWQVHRVLKCFAIATPHEHILHHTTDLHGNYGNFTTLWDRLFGTYLDPARAENQSHALGLPYDQDFLGVLTLGKVKLPERIRKRFDIGRYCNLHGRSAS